MIYLTYDMLCDVYEKVIEVSGGGAKGILDDGKVRGILEQVKNDLYYPEIEHKVSYLFFSLNKYHCFQDGNKRIALAVCIHFLNMNGYLFIMGRFIKEMENISIHVAAGTISKELLDEIVQSLIYEDDFSEGLKLKIINATILEPCLV
ncbi:type II toxin-antitoxin system death-on-curing family toxin [Clostridium perfringens]|uniref:type II toxin-antitoxin system death-on-curing family toxin n=1 Tax=Clostridium perfringens TaxID=1502 RepID=UPI00016BD584|nr:type II toxin-antitoxin system death-on-curing family toxin [Clostridium perfringens]EDT26671.1 death-on-curing family protein [Clostridium perfringens CPE str. F4969]MBS5969619.1 type II toxin-antitoxin system death-on-curing family toxin [Clostridium perfringens]SUY32180.1 death on curing protein [Clostridium perfringens]HAT4139584.1 type II toxin-antitoxin system death-on-curing family toxin [Clostridium perfringens]